MSHPYSMKSLPHAPGALIFTPCPGTQTSDLDESLETLKQAGAVALVTLMSDTELQKNGAGELGVAARQHGLEWYQLPIEDDQAPDQTSSSVGRDSPPVGQFARFKQGPGHPLQGRLRSHRAVRCPSADRIRNAASRGDRMGAGASPTGDSEACAHQLHQPVRRRLNAPARQEKPWPPKASYSMSS